MDFDPGVVSFCFFRSWVDSLCDFFEPLGHGGSLGGITANSQPPTANDFFYRREAEKRGRGKMRWIFKGKGAEGFSLQRKLGSTQRHGERRGEIGSQKVLYVHQYD